MTSSFLTAYFRKKKNFEIIVVKIIAMFDRGKFLLKFKQRTIQFILYNFDVASNDVALK